MGLKRVSHQQSVALEKIENEKSGGDKVSTLVNELKHVKSQLKTSEESLRKEEKLTINLRTQNYTLQE